MKTIKSTSDLSDVTSDKYWHLVRRTLKDVFNTDPDAAGLLEQDIQGSTPEEQILFYHTEALSVASEIANKTPSTFQIDRYKVLRDEAYSIP